ncbi:MAG: tubulin-like doman-containing protein, partial [Pseudomonadota bacterium]|nr:tubulin-like doman-containing protein [Pseudomonadota bacterium]
MLDRRSASEARPHTTADGENAEHRAPEPAFRSNKTNSLRLAGVQIELDQRFPKPGEHFPRAVAKGIYANAYYAGDRPMNVALRNFVDHLERATLPSLVTVCFRMAGGTGSGMVVDLARHLSNVKLGRRIPV